MKVFNKKKRFGEGSGMMVSSPGPVAAEPTFIDLIAREVQKLYDEGKIMPVIYYRSRDLLPILRTSILNIYSRRENGLQQALHFLLRQAGRGVK